MLYMYTNHIIHMYITAETNGSKVHFILLHLVGSLFLQSFITMHILTC